MNEAEYLWPFNGYKEKSAIQNEEVKVLKPRSFVNIFAGGYIPKVHSTINS